MKKKRRDDTPTRSRESLTRRSSKLGRRHSGSRRGQLTPSPSPRGRKSHPSKVSQGSARSRNRGSKSHSSSSRKRPNSERQPRPPKKFRSRTPDRRDRSERQRSGREFSPSKSQGSRSRHERKRDRELSSSPKGRPTGSRNRSGTREDSWHSRGRRSRKSGLNERRGQRVIFREDEERKQDRRQSSPSNLKHVKQSRPRPRGELVDRTPERVPSRRTSNKNGGRPGNAYEEHKHQEERERITEVLHSQITTNRVFSQYLVRTSANVSESKELGSLREQLDTMSVQLQIAGDRIENLVKQQQELEEKSRHFKRVQMELAVYERQQSTLEQRMKKTSKKMSTIQERENKKKKVAQMRKDLDASKEAMKKWSSRVNELSDTLSSLGVPSASTTSVLNPSVGNVALQEQPSIPLSQPSAWSQPRMQGKMSYRGVQTSSSHVANRSSASVDYQNLGGNRSGYLLHQEDHGQVPPLSANQKTKGPTAKLV